MSTGSKATIAFLLVLASGCGGDEVAGISVPVAQPPHCVVASDEGQRPAGPPSVWIVKMPRANADLTAMVMQSVVGLGVSGADHFDAVTVDLVVEPWTFDLRDGVELSRASNGVGYDLRFRSDFASKVANMVQGQRRAVLVVGIGPERTELRMIARRKKQDCQA